MSIRIPSSPVLAFTSSIASATTDAATVLLPQDTDSVTVMVTSSVFGITTLQTYVQTSPDGGTTWIDMGNIGVITGTTGATPTTALQQPWVATFETLSPVPNSGTTSVVSVGSVVTRAINQVGASVATAGTYTGVPILGRNLRIFHKATGTGASDILTRVFVQSQSSATG
jgi:hypothetical protein